MDRSYAVGKTHQGGSADEDSDGVLGSNAHSLRQ
jgi:hypothetical protein